MKLKILQDADPEGRAVLRTPTSKIEVFGRDIKQLALDMIDTMQAAGGVGLAANQVGYPVSMFVLDLGKMGAGTGCLACANPDLLDRDGETLFTEGCLSFSGAVVRTRRSANVTLQYFDALTNQQKTLECSGLLAVCVQHEYDHLLGRTMFDAEHSNV